MIAYAVAAISMDELGSGIDLDDRDRANYEDPNQDVIAAQQTEVARNPNDVEGLLLLANLLGNSGRLNEAIPVYERVLELRPEDTAARVDFARSLADGGYTADAELQFSRAIALDPQSQEAHYYLAELYRLSEPPRIEEAVVEYRLARDLDPATFIGQQAAQTLLQYGVGAPAPDASPIATPEVNAGL